MCERESVCVCVRERVYVCVRESVSECVIECVCVCVFERDRESVCECDLVLTPDCITASLSWALWPKILSQHLLSISYSLPPYSFTVNGERNTSHMCVLDLQSK